MERLPGIRSHIMIIVFPPMITWFQPIMTPFALPTGRKVIPGQFASRLSFADKARSLFSNAVGSGRATHLLTMVRPAVSSVSLHFGACFNVAESRNRMTVSIDQAFRDAHGGLLFRIRFCLCRHKYDTTSQRSMNVKLTD